MQPPAATPAHGGVSQLTLRGGTDATMAPPVGYAQHVLLPLLRRHLRVDVCLALARRGFYPKVRSALNRLQIMLVHVLVLWVAPLLLCSLTGCSSKQKQFAADESTGAVKTQITMAALQVVQRFVPDQ